METFETIKTHGKTTQQTFKYVCGIFSKKEIKLQSLVKVYSSFMFGYCTMLHEKSAGILPLELVYWSRRICSIEEN